MWSELAPVFLAGAFGGLANELLHWWGLRRDADFPEYAKRAFYWTITLAMILVGAGVATMQLGAGGDPPIAFQIGLLAPMLLKKMSSAAALEPEGAQGADRKPSLRRFLKG